MNNQANNKEFLQSGMGDNNNINNTNTINMSNEQTRNQEPQINPQTELNQFQTQEPGQQTQMNPQPEVVQPQVQEPMQQSQMPPQQDLVQNPTPQPVAQQMSNTNQPVNGTYQMNTSIQTPNKKSNLPFIIIVSVLGVIILALVLYIAFGDKLGLKGNDVPQNQITNGTNNANNTNTGIDDPTETPTSTGNTINVDGYEMIVPSGYAAKEIEGIQCILDLTNKIALCFSVEKGIPYSALIADKDYVKTTLEGKGIGSNFSIKEKKYESKNWLVTDFISNDGTPESYSFTELNSYDTLGAAIANYGQTKTTEQIYSDLNTMINNAKNTNSSSFSNGKNTSKNIKVKNIKIDSNIFND